MEIPLLVAFIGAFVALIKTLFELRQKNAEVKRLQADAERKRILDLKTSFYLPTIGAFSEFNRLIVSIPLVSAEELMKLQPSSESVKALQHKDIIASTAVFAAINKAMIQILESIQKLKLGRKKIDDLTILIDSLLLQEGQLKGILGAAQDPNSPLRDKIDLEKLEQFLEAKSQDLEKLLGQRNELHRALVASSMHELHKINTRYFDAVGAIRKELALEQLTPEAVKAHLDQIIVQSSPVADYHVAMKQ